VRWPQIRAGLVAVAIAFGVIDGLPLPDKPLDWQRGAVDAIRPVQRAIEWPVRWIGPALGVTQRWTLFQAAPRERYRMWIEGRARDGSWQIVYRAGDVDRDGDEDVLRYRRMRDAWDPSDDPASNYTGFCAWMIARVLARHAEYDAARVRMEKIVLDGGELAPTGQFVLACGGAR